jgi:hypothetical protein
MGKMTVQKETTGIFEKRGTDFFGLSFDNR